MANEEAVDFRKGNELFLLSNTAFKPALGPTYPRVNKSKAIPKRPWRPIGL
jgi:hypothetical protein